MRQVPLYFPFSLALFWALFGTVFLPHIRLMAFSPFLALLYNRASFLPALWIATLSGLIIDLLSSEFRLGIYALNYCLTTILLYKQKRHFFEDKPLAVSLFTFFISIVSTLLQLLLISMFDRALPMSLKLLITDLLIMPLADAVYAFLGLSCPMLLFAYIKKKGWRVFSRQVLSWLRFRRPPQEE